MTHTQTTRQNRIALHEGKKGVRSAKVEASIWKISYRAKTKTKFTKMQTHNTNSDIQR